MELPKKSRVTRGVGGWEIQFQAGADCGPFQGMYLTGGVPEVVDGKEVVKFRPQNVRGKWHNPIIRTEGRPQLQELAEVYRKMIEEDKKADAWTPDGFQVLMSAIEEYERALSEWNRTRFDHQTPKPESAKVQLLCRQYPVAAVFCEAELQERRVKHPDEAGLVPAARNCKRILRETGDLEQARKALRERREGFLE